MSCACNMLAADNRALKRAGGELAIAAAYVVCEYDGLHRLGLAIANWHKAVANEGGRGERHAAQGIETRRAETPSGSVHESPVVEDHAP